MDQFNSDEGEGDVSVLMDSDVDSGGPASDHSEFTNESFSEDEKLDLEKDETLKLKRRCKALLNNQLELLSLQRQQTKEFHELEVKYSQLAAPLINARLAIIQGTHEPTKEECDLSHLDWVTKMTKSAETQPSVPQPKQSEEYESLNESLENMAIGETEEDVGTVTVGVPDFWARAIARSRIPETLKDNCDLPILQHLVNVRLDMSLNPMGYSLYFDFSPNPFFTNTTLRKTFLTSCEQKTFSLLKSIDTPWVVATVGCAIDWKPFKNVTTKTVLVKQRSSQSQGSNKRYVMSEKEVTATSFFNFFKTISEVQYGEANFENLREELEEHFDIGEYFRNYLIPRAFLFYIKREMSDSESEYEEEEETESEEETNENNENMMPSVGYGKRFRNGVIVDLREKLNQKRNLQQQNTE